MKHAHPSRGFLYMEMLVAMALATMLVMIFASTIAKVRQLETLALEQGRSLIVIANVLERLEASDRVNLETARSVLEAEFAESQLHGSGRYAARCEELDGHIVLQVVRADGEPVVHMEVGP